jgi:hypothetical protein
MHRASMPELIRHGVTGFLCRSLEEMVDAVGQLGAIDRRACRDDCARRFSADRMVEDYLNAIRCVIRCEGELQQASPASSKQLVSWQART